LFWPQPETVTRDADGNLTRFLSCETGRWKKRVFKVGATFTWSNERFRWEVTTTGNKEIPGLE
jgi:hypothetical protein